MQKVFLLIVFISSSLLADAQTGFISGTITDAGTSEPIIGANIIIQGTQVGASTDVEGKFTFANVKPGTYNLILSFVTYKADTIKNVVVESGKTVNVFSAMREEAKELEEVIVQGQRDRTLESTLLLDRKNSILIVQGIGTQELSRKGVDDAEMAVTQVTGVSKQQGSKNVFVRGLGDRYNSTSLNGLPLPSEDPAFKNITLSFFSTDIIDNIEVNKTFTSNLYGDVGGANINIVSKKLYDEQEFRVSVAAGVNSQAVNNDFYRADGNNTLGITDNQIPITDLTNYSFKNSFDPQKLSGPLMNTSFSLSGGKTFYIRNNALKVFLVGAINNDYAFKEGTESFTNTEGQYRTDFKFKKYEYHASQFSMGDVSYEFGNDARISYNLVYIHDNKQFVGDYKGFSLNGVDDITAPNAYDMSIKRQQTNNNSVLTNQLAGAFNLTEKLTVDVRGSYSKVTGDEPDRRQSWLIGDGTGENYFANNSSPQFNHRFYSMLVENEMAANLVLSYKLKGKGSIDAGYNFRNTSRTFDNLNFVFANPEGASVNPTDLDAYFNQENIDDGIIVMETSRGRINNPNALNPFYYTGDRMINSGFVNVTYELTPSLSMIAGTRFEQFNQKVVWDVAADEIRPTIPGDNTSKNDKLYILPSVNFKYDLSDANQLRFSASKSYTFPQFKELAPFLYESVNYNSFGNPDLKPAENLNADLKFEHYFADGGLIAVTGYYKFIANSINVIQVNSASLEYSYLNTGDAFVVGGELEIRKKLFNLSRANENTYLSSGLNFSYLYAEQGVESATSSKVQFIPTYNYTGLEGASPILINTDLTFTKIGTSGNKFTSAAVLSYFSNRIAALGTAGQANIMERGIPTLDVITKLELGNHISVNLSFKNILNPEYRQTKEVLSSGRQDLILSYRQGVTSSIGFSYKF